MHDEKIVGYIMLAMGRVGRERQADLGIDAYGQMPALVITRLAVDERHERNGVGRYMATHAVDLAGKTSFDLGCRVVLADSEPDAVGFYEKMGYARLRTGTPLRAGGLGRIPPPAQRGARGEREGGALATMYADLGRDRFWAIGRDAKNQTASTPRQWRGGGAVAFGASLRPFHSDRCPSRCAPC